MAPRKKKFRSFFFFEQTQSINTIKDQETSRMSTPAQNTMNVNTPASIAAFQAKSAADKVLSYMWYIHVLATVNTESRLRTKIARVLEEHSVSPNASSPESIFSSGDQQRKSPDNQDKQQQKQQPALDLTDHLVLGLFSHTILTRLIDVPPVYAQADGYACILSDIPVDLREELCRRLYTLLFSQRIVEWPHGIDVPEPCIPAAEPILATAAVDDVSVKLEDNTSPSPVHEDREAAKQGNIGGAGFDGVLESQDDGSCGSPASSSLKPAASIWMQTPSLSSWDSDGDFAHMERARYFGTVSSPLPMDYFADWEWSRNESGPHRDSVDEQSMSGVHLMAPFPSPRQEPRGRALDKIFQVSSRQFEKQSLSSVWYYGSTAEFQSRSSLGIAGFRTQTRPSGLYGYGARGCRYLCN